MSPSSPLNGQPRDNVPITAVKTAACDKGSVYYRFSTVRNSVGYLRQRQSWWLQNSKREPYGDCPWDKELVDSGYQGIAKLYTNSYTPIIKSRGKPLTRESRTFDRDLAKQRIEIEHVNRWCKIFRIVKGPIAGNIETTARYGLLLPRLLTSDVHHE